MQPDASGHVQIYVDETRRRLVTGSLSDGNIERLMLAAAKDESNDGLRVESIELLKSHTASADVRDALLTALRNDPNPGAHLLASPLNQSYRALDAALVSLVPASIGNIGGSQAHLNMQPFLTLLFCIALQGIFPSQN